MGSGLNFFLNAIDKTPTTTGAWVDVDVSGDGVPAGSTGVILKIVSTAAVARRGEVRKNGSTDDFGLMLSVDYGRYAYVGIDANRVFEAYIGATTVKIYLVGYTDAAVEFFTNAIDKTPTTTGSWQDVDASGNIQAGATGVICLLYNSDTANNRSGGVRKNGSSDEFPYGGLLASYRYVYQICGVDANRIFEAKIDNTLLKVMLVGSVKSPITFFDNGIDKSLTVTSTWTDIDVTGDTTNDTDGVLVFIKNAAGAAQKGDIRKNGSTDNHTADMALPATGCQIATKGTDADQIFEGWIDNTAVDFYLIGYCKPAIIQVTDSISLSDVILTHKTLVIADVIGLADSQLTDKTLLVSDAISLADQVLRDKIFAVLDSIGLTDAVLRDKTFIITDAISLSDVVQVITEIIKEVVDSISLSDQVFAHKTFTITDSISLSEIVTVITEIIKGIKSDLSMLERGMSFELKEFGVIMESKEMGMKFKLIGG